MVPSIKNEKCSDMEPLNASEEEASMPVNDSEDSSSFQGSDQMEISENQVTNEGSNNVPKTEKRERKKVINFVAESPVTVSKKLDLDQGSGVPLDSSPYINHMINMMKSDELKFFHKILFLRPGSGLEIKKNIRKFKGYDFSKDSEKYKDLVKRIERVKSKSVLVSALGIVGLHVSGSKDELAERLAAFLVSPQLVTRTVSDKKSRKKRSSKKKSKKVTTKTRESKKAASKKEVSKQESSEKESDSESDDSGATKPAKRKRQEQESSYDEDSEPEVKKKTQVKKRKVLAKEKGDSNEETGRNKKSKKASLSKKKQDDKELSDDNSDDELLVKIVKPTDDDIESFIKRYMKSANLEEVTMKNIYQRVNDEFPTVDVASKKDFIKSSVKQILTR